MKRNKPSPVPMARVILDCCDGSKDYCIPSAEAHALLQQGKLEWDLTNSEYTTPTTHTKVWLTTKPIPA
jgi:hypothetical protein